MEKIIIEKRSLRKFKVGENKSVNLNILIVPRYQRRYDWKSDNLDYIIEELKDHIKEINRAINEMERAGKEKAYNIFLDDTERFFDKRIYLGNIVLTTRDTNNEFRIVDGQQRLTTIFLLLKFFEFESKNFDWNNYPFFSKIKIILNKTLIYQHSNGEETSFIQSDNVFDKDSCFKIGQCNNWVEFDNLNIKKSRYWKNMNYIREELSKESEDDLVKMLYALLTIDFGVVIVQNEGRAYELFETLNSRGIALSQSDLIKNLFYLKLQNQKSEEVIENEWKNIIEKIDEKSATASKITRSLRSIFVADKGEYIKKKELYKKVSEVIRDGKSANEWLEKIGNYLDEYNYFKTISTKNNATHWQSHNIKQSLNYIPEIYQPLLFKIFYMSDRGKNISIEDIVKILKYLEVQSFLHFAVNNLPSKELDKHVPKIIREIKNVDTYQGIKKVFDKYIKNETFRDDKETIRDLLLPLKTKSFDSRKQFMQLIELTSNYSEYKDETFKVIEWNNVQMEHLLPQEPSKWINAGVVTEKEAIDSKSLVGNLFPIYGQINNNIKNNLYHDKKTNAKYIHIKGKGEDKTLLNSDLFREQMIDAFGNIPEEWNKKMIDIRTKKIIDKLVKKINIWK